jgi:hypothetical protein
MGDIHHCPDIACLEMILRQVDSEDHLRKLLDRTHTPLRFLGSPSSVS